MYGLTSLLALVGLIVSLTSATALTFRVNANDRECFYAHVEAANAKVAFYFAVQSGGDFDINYVVSGPSKTPGQLRTILEGDHERQADYVFTAIESGEYRFCFDNTISTFSEKVIDFDISVENEVRANLPTKAGVGTEQMTSVEEAVIRLSGQVSTLTRQQKYFRTRENRNFSTVQSTEKRIFNFSLIESGLMVVMAGLQVFVVKMFFTGGRKGYV